METMMGSRRAAVAGLLLLLLTSGSLPAVEPLPALGLERESVTVSGVSSGGYMAVQYHIAYSGSVSGVGVIAGGPYECAEAGEWPEYKPCTQPDGEHPVPTTDWSVARIEEDAGAGLIDDPSGLEADRVWLLSGGEDHIVERPVVDALAGVYRHWIDEDSLAYVKVPQAGHAMLTGDEAGANACDTTGEPFINYCEGIDAPGQLLTHLLGELQPPAPVEEGRLLAFDQAPFTDSAGAAGMGETGYLYIPGDCEEGGCRLHVAFHGCRQSAEHIDTVFVERAGYNRWAEANRIAVLYPQTRPRYGWTLSGEYWWWPEWVFNPAGCWDWWGYDSDDYATRRGEQINAVRKMVERLLETP